MPLTLAFADALVVEVERVLFAIPFHNVGAVLAVAPEEVHPSSVEGAEFFCPSGAKLRVRAPSRYFFHQEMRP